METGRVPRVVCPTVVGRAEELQTLLRCLDDAMDGRGRAVVVSGEAGIGKSRLVRELAEEARARGCRVLWGRAVEASVPIAFRPITEALRSGLAPGEADSVLDER